MLEDIYTEVKRKMDISLKKFVEELKRLRTGRASITLLEGVKVNYYGTETPLNQVANLAAPDPHLLVVQPWDPSLLPEIEKAIQRADLGLNPMNDGKIIRVPVPPLTEERRKELAKVVGKMAEEAKTAVRQVRRMGNDEVKKLAKEKEISEDDEHRAYDKIQEITDSFIEKIEEATKKKKEEILEV
ncbi:MAG: ribosome recycling factor [Acidobacteria bacterium]|nr:ribosome recycling factor [Acidobacteriota bacterium]